METTNSPIASQSKPQRSKTENIIFGAMVATFVLDISLDIAANGDKSSAFSIGSDVAHILAVALIIALIFINGFWNRLTKVQKPLAAITMIGISISAVVDLMVDAAGMTELAELSVLTRATACVAALIALFIGLMNRRKARK